MNADMCSNDGNVKQHRFKRCSEEMDRARFSFTRGLQTAGKWFRRPPCSDRDESFSLSEKTVLFEVSDTTVRYFDVFELV